MRELVVDNFAGGGGASTGIEWALGRPVDYAINHSAKALQMHAMNHPETQHIREDVFRVDPAKLCAGRPVGVAWFSPDCRHFSIAKGGKPVSRKIRGLAWVAIRWARTVKPRIIFLENVKEFEGWGPLLKNGKPNKKKKGRHFRRWVRLLRREGYQVEWKRLTAADYGAATSRLRLFVIARRDGKPIIWPEPTHGPGREKPWHTAAECIDWSLPCPSIFTRKKPLAENTLKRIALGIRRYVIEDPDPFIVTNTSGHAPSFVQLPLATVTTGNHHYLVAPHVTKFRKGSVGHSMKESMHTITANSFQKRPGGAPPAGIVAAYLSKEFGGPNGNMAIGQKATEPAPTVTGKDHTRVVAAFLMKYYGTNIGKNPKKPAPTITSQGRKLANVYAYLVKYYKTGIAKPLTLPMDTGTKKPRFGLVMVKGEPHVIVDIGFRMLTPRELFRAQGFPDSYKIEGFTNSDQIFLCGNAVPPHFAKALVEANYEEPGEERMAA
ncbi:MAG: DNA cytosine methyltransferase [Bdellovibrionota bacterium]